MYSVHTTAGSSTGYGQQNVTMIPCIRDRKETTPTQKHMTCPRRFGTSVTVEFRISSR